MSRMRFRLFGNFQARLAGELSPNFITGKLEELFCFLLVHRQVMTARESLAALLWGNCSTVQSKKYLRDALWKLQEKLSLLPAGPPVLLASAECVRLNPEADVWADVAEFETVFSAVEKVRGTQLTLEQAYSLQRATALYRGDLLVGWYQDWCLCERARFQEMYLKMLHKLMLWCEANGQYEEGLHYGEAILRQDRAHERAHRSIMRLRYLANDRTGALHQYERLEEALASDLEVKPSRRSMELYEQIRADRVENLPTVFFPGLPGIAAPASHLPELLEQCKHVLADLKALEQQLQREVEIIELNLKGKG